MEKILMIILKSIGYIIVGGIFVACVIAVYLFIFGGIHPMYWDLRVYLFLLVIAWATGWTMVRLIKSYNPKHFNP